MWRPHRDLNILLTKCSVNVLTKRTNVLQVGCFAKVVLAPKKGKVLNSIFRKRVSLLLTI